MFLLTVLKVLRLYGVSVRICIITCVIKSESIANFLPLFLLLPQIQKEVEAELDRLVGQEGAIHTKMLALQRMGYSLGTFRPFKIIAYLVFELTVCSLICLQTQPSADRRRCQSAVGHDYVYLQLG